MESPDLTILILPQKMSRPMDFSGVAKQKKVGMPVNGRDLIVVYGGRIRPKPGAKPEAPNAPLKVAVTVLTGPLDLEFHTTEKSQAVAEAAIFMEMAALQTPSQQTSEGMTRCGLFGGNLERREPAKYHVIPFAESMIMKTYSPPGDEMKGGIFTVKAATYGAYYKEDPENQYNSALISLNAPSFMPMPVNTKLADFFMEENFEQRRITREMLFTRDGYPGYSDPRNAIRKPFFADLQCMSGKGEVDWQNAAPGTMYARFAKFTPSEGNCYYKNQKEEKFPAVVGYTDGKADDIDIYVQQRDLDGVFLRFINRTRLFGEVIDEFQLATDLRTGEHNWYQLGPNLIQAMCGTMMSVIKPKQTSQMNLLKEFDVVDGVVYTQTFVNLDLVRTVKMAGIKLSPEFARQFYLHTKIRDRAFNPNSGYHVGTRNAVNLLTSHQDKAEKYLENPNVEFYAVTNHRMEELDLELAAELAEEERFRVLLGEVVNRCSARYADKDKIVGALFAVVNEAKLQEEGVTRIPHISEIVRDDILAGLKRLAADGPTPTDAPHEQPEPEAAAVVPRQKKVKSIEKS
jgi:hypothetical protein